MRPLELILSAFGPYADQEVIHMESLGEKGLYLISGDTGSGKTTIFDGIMFALYGEASGDDRQASMLRSKYAQDDVVTYVQLTFEYHQKKYTVYRSLEYERMVKGKMRKKQAEVQLSLPDGTEISGLSKVNRKIEEIIGLNRKQFKQVAMIAQGDFRTVLQADTNARKQIFSKVFGTEIYGKIITALKDDVAEQRKKQEELDIEIKHQLESIQLSQDEAQREEFRQYQSDSVYLPSVKALLADMIEQDQRAVEATQEQIAFAEEKLGKENNDYGIALAAQEIKTEWNAAYQKLPILQKQLDITQKQKQAAEEKRPEMDRIGEGILLAQNELPQYDRLEESKQKCEQFESKLQQTQKQLQDAQQKKTQESETEQRLAKQLEAYQTLEAQQERCKNELDRQKERLEGLEEFGKKTAEYQKKKTDLDSKAKKWHEKKAEYQHAMAEYLHKETLFLQGQAAILAQGLTSGMPCPVCGAIEHPKAATAAGEIVSQQDYQQAKQQAETAQAEMQTLSQDIAQQEGSLHQMEEMIRQEQKKYLGECALHQILPCCREQYKKWSQEYKKLQQEQQNLNEKADEKEKLTREHQDCLQRIKEQEQGYAQLAVLKAQQQSDWENELRQREKLREQLLFDSKQAAQAALEEQKEKKALLEKELEQSKQSWEDKQREFLQHKEKIAVLEQNLSKIQSWDVAELHSKIQMTQKQLASLREKLDQEKFRLQHNRKILPKLSGLEKRLEDSRRKRIWLENIYQTAAGSLSGKQRLDLETYVQRAYFEKVVDKANLRFYEMSDGRFQLQRKKEADNLVSKSGLDLEVMDHYSGACRDVKTLSGGEAFEASLSLALGLSDMIQSYKGGIRLDTMFIDEGFGSLDETTRVQAMRVLKSLSEQAHLIGIISHVSELKREIEKQIIVTKGERGSKTKIILP